jgi:hypothetical protein
MRPYITVTLVLFTLVFVSCKKENLDNPTSKLQGTWRLLYSTSSAGVKSALLGDSTHTLRFEGNKMLTFEHDSLIMRESFLMAIKADRLPYLVADSDPWNPRIYSCTLTGADTLCLFAVHLQNGARSTYIRVKN